MSISAVTDCSTLFPENPPTKPLPLVTVAAPDMARMSDLSVAVTLIAVALTSEELAMRALTLLLISLIAIVPATANFFPLEKPPATEEMLVSLRAVNERSRANSNCESSTSVLVIVVRSFLEKEELKPSLPEKSTAPAKLQIFELSCADRVVPAAERTSARLKADSVIQFVLFSETFPATSTFPADAADALMDHRLPPFSRSAIIESPPEVVWIVELVIQAFTEPFRILWV